MRSSSRCSVDAAKQLLLCARFRALGLTVHEGFVRLAHSHNRQKDSTKMSWGQKKHTDAIIRAKYAEMKAREGPTQDGRPLSTTLGLRSGSLEEERRAPTSASLVGNDMNIVRHISPSAPPRNCSASAPAAPARLSVSASLFCSLRSETADWDCSSGSCYHSVTG